jgi:hypothetical protein
MTPDAMRTSSSGWGETINTSATEVNAPTRLKVMAISKLIDKSTFFDFISSFLIQICMDNYRRCVRSLYTTSHLKAQ